MKRTGIDVIVVGELNVDIILNKIEGFPVIGKEILAHTMDVTLGSSSAIFASNLSSMGTSVAFIGKTGNDTFADLVTDSLNRKSVDTSHIIRSTTESTGATIVLNYAEDRANITYPGAMNELCLNDIDFGFLGYARHLHFSSCFMQPGIRKDLTILFRRAKELGLTTSFDTQWDPEEKWDLPLRDLLPYVDVFLPNAKELQMLTGCNTIEEGLHKLQSFGNSIVVKNGIKGALAWDGNTLISQAAYRNEDVVDSIGAGDSFNAGFIHEFINHKPLKECLKIGALMGAINTTSAGGTSAFESQEMIMKTASDKFNYKF